MATVKKSFFYPDETGKTKGTWYHAGDDFPDDLVETLSNPASKLEGQEEFVDYSELPYDQWTVAALKDELATRELPVSGSKVQLVERLNHHDRENANT